MEQNREKTKGALYALIALFVVLLSILLLYLYLQTQFSGFKFI